MVAVTRDERVGGGGGRGAGARDRRLEGSFEDFETLRDGLRGEWLVASGKGEE